MNDSSRQPAQMSRQSSLQTIGVDKNAAEPVYQQLVTLIGCLIRRHYRIGDFLLPEIQLADHYQVNRHTVRRALDELVKQGIIVRKPGKGTMVVSSPIDYQITPATRFTATLESQGYETQSRLIQKSVERPNEQVCKYLALTHEQEVVAIRTLRHVAETPICLITQYFSLPRFSKLITLYRRGSIQDFLQRHYNVAVKRHCSFVTATLPTAEQCQHLRIRNTLPLLTIKTVNCDRNNGTPIEYSVSHNRSDCLQLQFATHDLHQLSGIDA